jgi:enamine deaminase RidA (YjgF/YER057c/UK114 family)
LVHVTGTTSVDASGAILGVTPYEQTVEILRRIEHELGRVGARLADVVQTRFYVTDISRSEEVGRAHGEVFGDIRPCMTMVAVAALIDPRMLVEVEAVAVV